MKLIILPPDWIQHPKIPDHSVIEYDRPTSTDWYLLDSFDLTLKNQGLWLAWNGRRAILFGRDTPPTTDITPEQETPDWSSWHPGIIRETLTEQIPLRALRVVGKLSLSLSRLFVTKRRKSQPVGNLMTLEAGTLAIHLLWLKTGDRTPAARLLIKWLPASKPVTSSLEALWKLACPGTPDPRPETPELTPDAPLFDIARQIMLSHFLSSRLQESGICEDLDTEYLHDYRICLRKIRSVLTVFKGAFLEQETGNLKTEFSRIMKDTNRLRDLDVYLLDEGLYRQQLPEDQQEGLDHLFQKLKQQRDCEQEAVARLLTSSAYHHRMTRLQTLLEDPAEGLGKGPKADERVVDVAKTRIRKQLRKIRKLAMAVDGQTPDETLHSLRVDFKKLRYMTGFFSSLFPKPVMDPILKTLRRQQNSLGRFNDSCVQKAALTEMRVEASRQPSPDAQLLECLDSLIQIMAARQEKTRIQAINRLAELESPAFQQQTKQLLK